MARSIVGRLVAALALAASATVAQAQSSTLSGKVTDGEKGTPIGGANVQAVSGMTVAGKATTGDDGSYRLTGLVDGSYVVIVSRIGYAQRRTEGVMVRGATTFNATMTEIAAKLNPIAVTATRGAQPQKQLEIPASLSVVSSEAFDNKPAPTLASYLSRTPGLSISSGGILQTNLV
jgi:iron complex outermembrane receptor protein